MESNAKLAKDYSKFIEKMDRFAFTFSQRIQSGLDIHEEKILRMRWHCPSDMSEDDTMSQYGVSLSLRLTNMKMMPFCLWLNRDPPCKPVPSKHWRSMTRLKLVLPWLEASLKPKQSPHKRVLHKKSMHSFQTRRFAPHSVSSMAASVDRIG